MVNGGGLARRTLAVRSGDGVRCGCDGDGAGRGGGLKTNNNKREPARVSRNWLEDGESATEAVVEAARLEHIFPPLSGGRASTRSCSAVEGPFGGGGGGLACCVSVLLLCARSHRQKFLF